MSVHAKHRVRGVGRLQNFVSAADIMKSDHPLNHVFTAWLKAGTPSKRKAREFLSHYPQYREVRNG